MTAKSRRLTGSMHMHDYYHII